MCVSSMRGNYLNRRLTKPQSVVLIICLIIFLAILFWLLFRTDLSAMSNSLGMIIGMPLGLYLQIKLGRKYRMRMATGWVISDHGLALFLQMYAVVFSAVTIIAYFDLRFVSYFIGMICGIVLWPLLMAVMFRYVGSRNTKSAHD